MNGKVKKVLIWCRVYFGENSCTFEVVVGCSAKKDQQVCVCVGPRFTVFLILCQSVYAHQRMSASTCFCVYLPACMFICALYMSGWLCIRLLAFAHAFVFTRPSLSFSICMCMCSPGLSGLAFAALCCSSDSVSGGMAVGWASTAGTLGPMGDNHCCPIAERHKEKKKA